MPDQIAVKPLHVYPKQQDFLCLTSWVRGFVAGRGSGKTHIGAADRILKAKNGEQHMIVSPTVGDIREVTWPVFRDIAERLDVWIDGVVSPRYRCHIRTQDKGVAEFVFLSAEKPERLRGPSKASLWLDEAGMMNFDVFRFGAPILRWKGKMGPVLLTFTPRGKNHWTYERFYTRDEVTGEWIRKPDAGLVKAHTRENPFAPPDYYDQMRTLYSKALAEQELGGEFVDLEGLMFQREWFRTVDKPPEVPDWVRYWDKAGSEGTGSYTAGVLIGRDSNGIFYITHVVRGQWSYGERDKIMLETAYRDRQRHGDGVLVFVEQEGGSGGKESMQRTIKLFQGFNIHRDIVSQGKRIRASGGERLPGQAKIDRAGGFQAQAEAGNVRLVRDNWNQDYLEELACFPEYSFSDQVDATSGAFNKLAARAGLDIEAMTSATMERNAEALGVQHDRPSIHGGPGRHARHGVHLHGRR